MDERLLRITLLDVKDSLERHLFLVGQLSIGCGPLAGVVAGTIEAAQVMRHGLSYPLNGMVFNFKKKGFPLFFYLYAPIIFLRAASSTDSTR